MSAVVSVRGLKVELPDGTIIVEAAEIELLPGQIVSLLGPSGAGKSTLVRALLTPGELREKGYGVSFEERNIETEPAFVPQRGALLDHLDVSGNIAVAQRASGKESDVDTWLSAVDLDKALGKPGRSVASLSGGQAQRIAVARALAAGRKLIVLDEPSVGLDVLGVRLLSELLRKQATEQDAAMLVITHDIALAACASDRILFLNPETKNLTPALPEWSGPIEEDDPNIRRNRIHELESAVETLLLTQKLSPSQGGKRRGSAWNPMAFFKVMGEGFLRFFEPHLFKESAVVLRNALVQSLLRPLLFYAIVGVLLGITVPYVIVHISEGLKPRVVLGLIGGSYVLSLAPPLSAIVFSATSGSAVNAWLGGLRLHGQVTALSGLGIPPERYLWSPAWMALLLAYLTTVLVFIASMMAGGYALFQFYDVPYAFDKLTSDILDPPNARLPYLIRGVWLVLSYALATATIAVTKGRAPKERSEEVTQAMTSAVMQTTLFVVLMELVTIVILFSVTGARR